MKFLRPGETREFRLACCHGKRRVDGYEGQLARRCMICKEITYYTVLPVPSSRDDLFQVIASFAPVEPAATPLAAETFPGTGRRGRGGNLAPAGNTVGAA